MTVINTLVSGSIGTCLEAADWLDSLSKQGHEAGNEVIAARQKAEATWRGEGAEEFLEETNNLGHHSDDIAKEASDSARALREFSSSLDAVNDAADQALATATAAGLRIDGPLIVAPKQPTPPDLLPTGPCGSAEAQRIMQQNQEALAAYKAGPLATYNAQIAAFNKAKSIMGRGRTVEENAHHELRRAMSGVTKTTDTWVSHMFTTTASARSYIGNAENPRRAAAATAERLRTQSEFLNRYALGAVASTNPAQQRILDRAASLARDSGKAELRAQQFEKWVKIVPEKARTALTAYPGQSASENLARHAKAVNIPKAASRTLRSLPYVGAGLTVTSEVTQTVSGQQSWVRGVADTTAILGGGALGGAAGGAALGSVFGPPGTVVGGLLGGLAGGLLGQEVVEGVYDVID